MKTRTTALGELVEIEKGKKASSILERPTATSRRYLQIDDLRPDAKAKYVEPFECVTVTPSDAVIAWDGANAGTASFNLEGYIGSTLAALRPATELYAPYLARFLEGKFTYLQANTTGATIPHLSKDVLEDLRIPLPSLSEQRRVAGQLERADRLRRTRRYALALSDTFLPAAFREMFREWQTAARKFSVKPLEEVVQPDRGVTYGIVQAGPHIPGGVPYIRTGDIIDGEIRPENLLRTSPEISESYKRSEVKFGDLVFSIRATVGTVAVLPKELDGANLTQGTARIAPGPGMEKLFLLWQIRMPETQRWLMQHVKGSTFFEITLAKLREMPVFVPPASLQERWAGLVARHERLRSVQRESLRQADHLFQTLLHRAFTTTF
ncbi:MAG: restriction endonuclease subunit S [Verrucomicrobiia bacterium]